MKKLIVLTPFIAFLLSCEKEIELKADEKEPRIVVNGIFSANDTFRVHLSESRPVLYEDQLPNITTASLKLLDANGQFLADFVHQGDGLYQVNSLLAQAGQTYRISCSVDGFDAVEATSYCPSVISITSVDTIRKGENMYYDFKFTDQAGEKNYYAVTVNKISIYEDPFTGDVYVYEEPYFNTDELISQTGYEDADGSKWGTIFLFSDNTFDGQQVSFNSWQYSAVDEDTTYVAVGLRSVSEDYFKYKVSLSKYEETAGSAFAQPVQVYSNVENGFGIFGGYSLYTDTLLVP